MVRMDNPEPSRQDRGMTQHSKDSDVLIVGGGLNGPVLALALAQAGISVTIIDAQPQATLADPEFDGRAYALALASQRMLAALNLWEPLAPQAQPMLEIKVSEGHAGQGPAPFWMHFDHAEIEEGPMGFMVEDRHLRPALLKALNDAERVTVLNEETVVAQDVSAQGASVTLSSGAVLNAALLVGCDGRQSGTATRAGIKRIGWDYGQTALVCAIEHELAHDGVAHQFFMPPGPLAILPLSGNRSSIVWSEKNRMAEAINALPEAEYLDVLRPRFGSFLGEIQLAGARFTYPLNLTLAEHMTADRIALVGDAAHGVHPIAGQGLNAGLRDVAALAEIVIEARRRGEDLGAATVLGRYQEWRRFDTQSMALATDVFNRLFSNDNPVLRLGRNLGLGLVSRVPGLRRQFIREAAGLTGDVPKLLQGQRL